MSMLKVQKLHFRRFYLRFFPPSSPRNNKILRSLKYKKVLNRYSELYNSLYIFLSCTRTDTTDGCTLRSSAKAYPIAYSAADGIEAVDLTTELGGGRAKGQTAVAKENVEKYTR